MLKVKTKKGDVYQLNDKTIIVITNNSGEIGVLEPSELDKLTPEQKQALKNLSKKEKKNEDKSTK